MGLGGDDGRGAWCDGGYEEVRLVQESRSSPAGGGTAGGEVHGRGHVEGAIVDYSDRSDPGEGQGNQRKARARAQTTCGTRAPVACKRLAVAVVAERTSSSSSPVPTSKPPPPALHATPILRCA
ncbi:uncharacterized protein EI97DRAFT_90230 [Westerdykella ornata]|uniref:Uncharacterized protein n=1 Tax=Westerdykella ornata TaxID=318751 RepID=A0A6A6JGR8_WESOR|nr:uncharacterized protein EI97DRAFT_90230 [Westerdykella ornata]KAF2274826.1 hypothetical protein EI97DRAFT_90230 [Westerdykella ornata]